MACLGSVMHELEDHLTARDLYSKALEVFREVGNRRWEGAITSYMGLWWLESNDLDEASRCCRKAEAILEETGDIRTKAFVQSIMGAVEAMRGHTDLAARAFKSAGSVALKLNDSLMVLTIEAGRAFLDIAFSNASRSAGSDNDASDHKDNALTRLARAQAVLENAHADDESSAWMGDMSDILRIMVRILKKRLS